MACHAKGLICTPMSAALAGQLGLPQMVSENTDNHSTAFTVSVDHVDTTTGISAAERGYTMRSLTEEGTKPQDLRRPGHVFPLVARHGGVLVRNGHTEATVDLMRLAGLKECGICCEIMEEDGTMMRTENLWKLAKKYDLKFITIKDLQGEPMFIESSQFHIYHLIMEKCAESGFEPDIIFQTSGFSLCHKMVKENKGISVVVDFVYDDMREEGMKLIPFSDGIYEWKACMLTRRDEEENEGVQCFRKHVQEWLQKIRSGEITR